MFQLAGYAPAAAKRAADAVFAMETRLAKAQLDNVALRDPAATDHKVTIAALQKMTPKFNWSRYLDRAHVAQADLNVDQPKFMAAVDRELTRAYLLFQTDLSRDGDRLAAEFAARYDRWQATARFPRLIKDVYLVAPERGEFGERHHHWIGEAAQAFHVEHDDPPQGRTAPSA